MTAYLCVPILVRTVLPQTGGFAENGGTAKILFVPI